MRHENLKYFLQSFNVLSEAEIDDFIKLTSLKILKKGEYFIKEGETCKHVAFWWLTIILHF